MIQKGYNTFHINLKDVRTFNPSLGGFLAQNCRNLDSEVTKLVKNFIEGLNFGELKNGLYFILIGGKG